MKPSTFVILLATFSLRTWTSAQAHDTFLRLSGPPNEYISLGQSYSYDLQNASFRLTQSLSDGSLQFGVTAPPGPTPTVGWSLAFAPYPGNRLEPGVYSNASRFPFQFQQPGLNVQGDGRGCNQLSGSIVVLHSAYAGDGTLTSFHATFDQYCENGPLALTGEISYEAAQPIPMFSRTGVLLFSTPLLLSAMVAIRS